MEQIKLTQLLHHISAVEIKGSQDIEITGLSSNSKQVAPGNLFIAKRWFNVDGAKYIPQAILAGAAAVLTDRYDPTYSHITQLISSDVLAAEAALSVAFYPSRLFLVGITGTNGKTTTSYLIRHLLEKKEGKCGLIGTVEWNTGNQTYPSSNTTPDLLQNYKLLYEMAKNSCQSCAMEVSSHALDQGRVRGFEFDVGILTNLTQDHLDYHPSMQAYGAAKAKLFASSKVAVINADSDAAAQMLKACTGERITYGIEQPCDLQASGITLTSQGMQFTASFQGKQQRICSPLIGRFNLYNLLAAIGAGLAKGLTLEEIAESFKDFFQVPGRLERVPNSQGLSIFVDYAHTDDALSNVLKTLQEMKKGRLITLFGCGGDRDRNRRLKMGAVAESLSDLVIVTSDNPRSEDPEAIIHGILTGMQSPKQALVIVNREEAIQKAIQLMMQEDLLLIAGKGHENTQVFSSGTIPFDDLAVAEKACYQLPTLWQN
jgi:UDP-N-acetylmuramoyl-L-alanyl-D-glutamate--2,6-diaminopimelate ligase